MPSPPDVYSFLKYRHLRAVTVGATRIWVFDKTPETLQTVRRLAAWEGEHLLPAVSRLERARPYGWEWAYLRLALNPDRLHFFDSQSEAAI